MGDSGGGVHQVVQEPQTPDAVAQGAGVVTASGGGSGGQQCAEGLDAGGLGSDGGGLHPVVQWGGGGRWGGSWGHRGLRRRVREGHRIGFCVTLELIINVTRRSGKTRREMSLRTLSS